MWAVWREAPAPAGGAPDPLAELLLSLVDPRTGEPMYPDGKFPDEPERRRDDRRRRSR